jgi:hypothetical protein
MIAGSFGLAVYPWQLAVMRCLMGIFGLGGMQAIILGEITDSDSSSQGKLHVLQSDTVLTYERSDG